MLNFYDISDGLIKPGIFLEGGFKRILIKRRETPHLMIPKWDCCDVLAGIVTNSTLTPGQESGTVPI
jgi:hypothetical protein